jgi:hypothetical protein
MRNRIETWAHCIGVSRYLGADVCFCITSSGNDLLQSNWIALWHANRYGTLNVEQYSCIVLDLLRGTSAQNTNHKQATTTNVLARNPLLHVMKSP